VTSAKTDKSKDKSLPLYTNCIFKLVLQLFILPVNKN
jgi:hypothetical protein